MRKILVTLATALLLPTYATAQVEIGTRVFGADILTGNGTLTNISIPGGGIFTGSTSYLMFFPSPSIMIGPEIGFGVLDGGGTTITTLGSAVSIGYLFSTTPNSAYLSGNVALQYVSLSGSGSETELGAGAAIGYRAQPISHVAVGVEGGYRRWFDLEVNEIIVSLKLGVVFP